MAAVVNTGLSTPGLKAEFFQRFDEVNKGTWWEKLATRIAARTATEKFRFLGSVPPVRAFGTGRMARGLNVDSYDVTAEKYEATLEIDRDEIADDQLGQINIRVRELADRAAAHKDVLIGSLIKNGATSGFNSYDGVTFFNANHVSGASGNQSNALTYDAATPTTPTTAEFSAALNNAIAAMLSFKDDQGEQMTLSVNNGLVVIVPPSMGLIAAQTLNSSLIGGGNTNVLQGVAQLAIFPHIASEQDRWYLASTGAAVRPFVLLDREPITFDAKEGESEVAFTKEKFLYGVRGRYTMTYGYWQYCVRTVFT